MNLIINLMLIGQGVFIPGYMAGGREYPAQFFGQANIEDQRLVKVFAKGGLAQECAKHLVPGQQKRVKVAKAKANRYEILGLS